MIYYRFALIHRKLQQGDQIAVEGEQCGIDYFHHGIFLGHEKGVADFGGATKSDATVRVVDIMQFTIRGERKLVRINYPNGGCLSPEIVVKNAEKLVESPDMMGVYNVLKNNCEHFATKCKIGLAVSDQVIQKQRACIENPLNLIKYGAASSQISGSTLGSIGSA